MSCGSTNVICPDSAAGVTGLFNRVRSLPVVPSVSRAQSASPTRTNPGAGSQSSGFIRPSAGRAQLSRRRATVPSKKLCACAARCLLHTPAEQRRQVELRYRSVLPSSLMRGCPGRLERTTQLYAW